MNTISGSSSFRVDGRIAAIGIVMLCAGMIAVGAALEHQAIIAIAALLAIPSAVLMFVRPDAAVPVVLFVLYSNAAVVAVRFHGVPTIAAMLVPVPLLIPLFWNIVLRNQTVVITSTLPWILLFVGWQLICAMVSADSEKSVNGVLVTVLEGLLIYLLITNAVRTPQVMRTAMWGLVAAGAFMGSVSAYQQATGSFDTNVGGFGQISEGGGFEVSTGNTTVRQFRLCGPIGEQNRYAQVMLMLIPLALARVLTERTNGLRLMALAAAGLIALGCGLTFSRSGAIAFVLMLLVGLAVRFVSRRQVAVAFVGGLVLLLIIPQYRTRLGTIPSAIGVFGTTNAREERPDGAILGRATEMLAAARMAIDHPLCGVGPDLSGTFTREYGQLAGLRALEGDRETHCLYLEVAAETGVPGFLLFIGMLSTSIRSLLGSRHQICGLRQELEPIVSGFLLALTGYLTMGLFLHMSYVRYFWLMLAMADACTTVALSLQNQTSNHAIGEVVT